MFHHLLYSTSPEQNINIRVGLPLNSVDGGTGGVEGAWNGRTQGIGGGGCAGSLNVDAPVNAGYVGSGTDTGHTPTVATITTIMMIDRERR